MRDEMGKYVLYVKMEMNKGENVLCQKLCLGIKVAAVS